MKLIDHLMGQAWAYRLWQQPFADKKFVPIDAADIADAERVLDVGCGPGTNAKRFAHTDYLGVDLNPGYIKEAREKQPGRFEVGDAAALGLEGAHDFILANSLYHHLDDDSTNRSLASLSGLLAPDGHIHILDLVRPGRPGPAALLAHLDRGDFPRPLARWREIFGDHFQEQRFEPYGLKLAGVTLWHMVYFKGSRR